MKYEINHNFTGLAVGETCCYHVGNLAADRFIKEDGRFTDEARILQTVSSVIYNRSCALGCSGEFELKQVKLGLNDYAYLAKRVKQFE